MKHSNTAVTRLIETKTRTTPICLRCPLQPRTPYFFLSFANICHCLMYSKLFPSWDPLWKHNRLDLPVANLFISSHRYQSCTSPMSHTIPCRLSNSGSTKSASISHILPPMCSIKMMSFQPAVLPSEPLLRQESSFGPFKTHASVLTLQPTPCSHNYSF